MKTYNDNFKGAANNRSNWEMVKEFGHNSVGANAYDYVIIVRKNGERLTCSDAESWEENTKGLRLASVAYCLMWCAFEYTDGQREEAKANGERLTRGVSSVIDFTANEAGHVEYLEEVLANRSNTECEYYNGTTGAIAKDNGTADTIAQDYAENTENSEQFKQLKEAQDALYKLGRTARNKDARLMHKFVETLDEEDKAAWMAQNEICHDIDEREQKLHALWHECDDAWNALNMPKVEKVLAALEAETTEDENEPKQETELQRLECREGGELVNLGTGETVGTWGTDEDGEFVATIDDNHHYTSVLIVNDPMERTETTTEDENEADEWDELAPLRFAPDCSVYDNMTGDIIGSWSADSWDAYIYIECAGIDLKCDMADGGRALFEMKQTACDKWDDWKRAEILKSWTTEDENDTTEDNTPQGGKEATTEDENEPKGETLDKVAKVAQNVAKVAKVAALATGHALESVAVVLFLVALLFVIVSSPLFTYEVGALLLAGEFIGWGLLPGVGGFLLCLVGPFVAGFLFWEFVKYTTPCEYIMKRFAALRTA